MVGVGWYRFPSFFELSLQKEESMGDVWVGSNESWVFRWVREFSSNEFLDFLNLWQYVHSYKVKLDVADSWHWQGAENGSFSTKEMYDVIVEAVPREEK